MIARRAPAGALAIAALFLALHLPFLPASLEDVDSINFALGLRRFDVARHQPHPPGYPVFIALAHAARPFVPTDAQALALVGIVAGALGALAIVALFDRLGGAAGGRHAAAGALVAIGSPLYWLTAARPLSDVTGLAAAVAVQAATLAAATPAAMAAAAAAAGLASGIRSQVAVLTVPLLAWVVVRRFRGHMWRVAAVAAAGFAVGVLLWAVPLVVLTGGPGPYWHTLFDQGAEDLSGIQMLWTTPTPRVLASGLYYAFVAPWATWPLAATALVFAGIGLWRLERHGPGTLVLLAVAYLPYFLFDLLFQETFTTRYALPLVVPITFLVVRGLEAGPSSAVPRVAVALAAWSIAIGAVDLRAYASAPAPAFQMLALMREQASVLRMKGDEAVLAAHRREDLDLRRPLAWEGDAMPRLRRLPAPPRREWLELVKYWTGGGRATVWFAADPLRSDLALIDRGPSLRFDWPLADPVLLGGVRPSAMTWYMFARPGWFLGEGWALTPETAGLAVLDHRGPAIAPIDGWIRRRAEPVTVMIGGRNMRPDGEARLQVAIDGRSIEDQAFRPGFFLRMIDLPAGALEGPGDYARLTAAADDERLSIEQFDAQSRDRVMFGYGDGWYEHEYNPQTGVQWRWTAAHSNLVVRPAGHALRLALAGVTETFSRPSHVTVRTGERVLAQDDVGARFSIEVGIPASAIPGPEAVITIDTDQTFVPAERSRRTGDRRSLGLKVTSCLLVPAS